jgi:hypothetical protein
MKRFYRELSLPYPETRWAPSNVQLLHNGLQGFGTVEEWLLYLEMAVAQHTRPSRLVPSKKAKRQKQCRRKLTLMTKSMRVQQDVRCRCLCGHTSP